MHLLDLLEAHSELGAAATAAQQCPSLVQLAGVPSPAWGAVAAFLQRRSGKTVLLVVPTFETADRCINDLRALCDPDDEGSPLVLVFPTPDRAGVSAEDGEDAAVGSGSRASQERLAALDAVHGDRPLILVATVNALAHPTLPPGELKHGYDQIVVGQTLDRDAFVEHLAGTGYLRIDQVQAPGQFAARGGIIDFYPPASQAPLRIELFGDEVDSIRPFELDSQRSIEKIQSLRLTPPREVYLTLARGQKLAEQLESLLEEEVYRLRRIGQPADADALHAAVTRDILRLRQATYFSGLDRYTSLIYPDQPTLLEHLPETALVVWADPERCRTQIERLLEEEKKARDADVECGRAVPLPLPPYCSYRTLRARAAGFCGAELQVAPETVPDLAVPRPGLVGEHVLDIHLPHSFGGKLDQLLEAVKTWQRHNAIIVLSTAHSRRVREILADGEVRHVHLLDAMNEAQGSLVLVKPQRLSAGFTIEIGQSAHNPQPYSLVVLTDAEMFGWQAVQPGARPKGKGGKKKEKKNFSEKSSPLAQLNDLKEGDYVVHINHGIARYAGTMRQSIAGAVNDYLLLEYDGQDRLYVPVQQLDRVQRYIGSESAAPPLNSLRGAKTWEKTKKLVREETIQVAKQLAELYAAREEAHKEPIALDTPWQREMESAFPFEETDGQLQAIKDVKSDLESDKPMDRLVCGDVGYGKTEVAVRAAFKVVQDGKQVAVLVPTTVLAQQHYQTFSERLSAYPTRVEVLSRFRTPAEQKKLVEDVRLGSIDILIGTHRLVQKDVQFRDLGLVVVDEEQRFGVLQKERLKELRKEVDLLTLSATPIPRTLHFALGGLREISLITDPPQGRIAVRTFVMPFRDEVMRSAIERELEREGQVYYVHNRIGSIAHIAERLHKLVPNARIGIGHGQMEDGELEQVMLDFMHHRTDVLLSTTIVENGLDLPNVNTLIVDRAELLGLSQMYQLRGRVGRSTRQGYAYFFSGSRGKLAETAENRFAALQEFTDLGAGFKIAMRDLEIRGAGELLGVKQSGGMAQVGFEMYTDMLSEAVGRLRHQPLAAQFKREELPEADLPVPAYLPEEFVPQERDRLGLYRKMANITTVDEVKHLQDELRDRFGPLPTPVFNLLRVLRIRVFIWHARLRGISKTESEVLLRLKPSDRFTDADTTAVFAAINGAFDKRALQNVTLRAMEGFAVDTRVLSSAQLLRMVEIIAEALGTVRGARFMGG